MSSSSSSSQRDVQEIENQVEAATLSIQAAVVALRKHRQETESRSALEQVAASEEIQAQLQRIKQLQSALDEAGASAQTLRHQLATEQEQRKRAGEVVLHLRGAIEEELWRIAGALHEKQR